MVSKASSPQETRIVEAHPWGHAPAAAVITHAAGAHRRRVVAVHRAPHAVHGGRRVGRAGRLALVRRRGGPAAHGRPRRGTAVVRGRVVQVRQRGRRVRRVVQVAAPAGMLLHNLTGRTRGALGGSVIAAPAATGRRRLGLVRGRWRGGLGRGLPLHRVAVHSLWVLRGCWKETKEKHCFSPEKTLYQSNCTSMVDLLTIAGPLSIRVLTQ